MNSKISNYLGLAGIIALLAIAIGVFSYTSTYSRSIQPSSFRSFNVAGEGEVSVTPDIAKFSFEVITEGGLDVSTLQDRNSERMNETIAFVKEQGIGDEDVKTTNYSVSPRYQSYRCNTDNTLSASVCPPTEIVGYTVRQSAEVKVRDFGKVGDMLSGVVKNGADSVTSFAFTVDDPTEAKNEARAEAIKQAYSKAKAIADAAGFSVGRILSIYEDTYSPYSAKYSLDGYGMGGSVESASVPSLEPGTQDVTIRVNVQYEIR